MNPLSLGQFRVEAMNFVTVRGAGAWPAQVIVIRMIVS